jgi:hypothetical protein
MNFDQWWNEDYDDKDNPFEKDSFGYWAYAGWCAALAQPEQEPVTNTIETVCALLRQAHDVLSLSSLPPKREWVSLTDEECDEIWGECLGVFDCLKMTEAKLKEKNNG